MLKNTRDGIEPDDAGNVGPIKQLEQLKQKVFHWLMSAMLSGQALHVNPPPTLCFGLWGRYSLYSK